MLALRGAVRRPLAAVLLALLGSCDLQFDQVLPENATRFSPPAAYELWSTIIEQCSGHRLDRARVRYYSVPTGTLRYDGTRIAGLTVFDFGFVTILLDADFVRGLGDVVRHEMLHAVLGPGYGHPREYFLERCAGIVPCAGDCLVEGGPWPLATEADALLDPSRLALDISVTPSVVSVSRDSGYVAFTVSARWDGTTAVRVPLRTDGMLRGGAFWYTAEGVGGASVLFNNDTTVSFAPGQTQRFVFTQRIYPSDRVIPSSSSAIGGVSSGASPPVQFQIVP